MTRFMLEGCVEIGLSAMISMLLTERETFQNGWEVVSWLLSIVALVVMILAPILTWRLSQEYLKHLQEGNEEKNETDELFEGYRANKAALIYPFVFFLRRYLMILILTVMPWSKYSQILGQIYGTIFVIYYLSHFRPFTEGFLNLQERVNEITVLFAAYPLFVFTDWVGDEDRKTEAGWYLVSCILLNILFNIAVLVYFLCKDLIRKAKRKYIIANKKAEREMKLRKEKEEQEA